MRSILALLLVAGIAGCSKEAPPKEVAAPVPVVAASAAEPDDPKPSDEQMLAAMIRGNPGVRKVCIDGTRYQSFFLDFGTEPNPPVEGDNNVYGWKFVEKIEFYMTSNNTYFIVDIPADKYIPVYPDVTGLTCK